MVVAQQNYCHCKIQYGRQVTTQCLIGQSLQTIGYVVRVGKLLPNHVYPREGQAIKERLYCLLSSQEREQGTH